MGDSAAQVSVIVPVAGRSRHLRRLMLGMAAQSVAPSELVIVDMDGSVNGREISSAGQDLAVRVIRLDHHGRELPLSSARNRGAYAATSPVLLFLDVDCIPGPEYVADYLVAARRYPGALWSGPVRYLRRGWDAGARPSGAATDPRHLMEHSETSPIRPSPPTDRRATEVEYDLFWSLNFSCSSDTFARLGGFDERYAGYGAEDTDLGRRARATGVPVVWLSGGLVFHQWHEPSRDDPGATPSLVANAARFHETWGDWPMQGWLEELARDGRIEWAPDGDTIRTKSPARP